MPDQRRLARADVAGDDDEALALREAVAEIGHRGAMGLALEPEARVRRQLEGAIAEPVVAVVHARLSRRYIW